MREATTRRTAARSSELPELPVLGNQHKWNTTKIVLRSISLVCAVFVTGLLISFNFAGRRYVSTNSSFAITVVTTAWDTAEFVVICVRRDKGRGIKAEVHVGVDLVLWLGAVGTLAFQALFVSYRSGLVYYGSYNGTWPNMPWYALDIAHLTFLGFLPIIHFILFVRACVEVDRRKKDRRVQELILAMQKHGQNPQDYPLSAFRGASNLQLPAPPSAAGSSTLVAGSSGGGGSTSAPGDREFSTKYSPEAAAPVPELLESAQRLEMDARDHPSQLPADAACPDEMPVHPEEMRNQKVLIGSFPR